VFGTVEDAGAGVPGVLAEEEREEGEEEAGDLEPQGGADMLEGLPEGLAEAASAFTDTAGGLDEIFFQSWRRGWCGRARRWGGLRSGCGCVVGLGGALFDHPRGDTDADAEFASEAVRLHGESVIVGGTGCPGSACGAGDGDRGGNLPYDELCRSCKGSLPCTW